MAPASSCCGPAPRCGLRRPHHLEPVRRRPGRRGLPIRAGGVARLRQPDGAGRAASRARRCSTSARAAASTSCSRPGASDRPARLRPRHDRRDAGARARRTSGRAGSTNVEFLKGEIEHIPLPDNSVDVIISNCVINLSADKDRVLREAFRVLKPGGRFAVSDVVVRGEVPDVIRKNMELWIGCVAGALRTTSTREAREGRLRRHRHRSDPASTASTTRGRFLAGEGLDADALAKEVDGTFVSGFVRRDEASVGPVAGPSCCACEAGWRQDGHSNVWRRHRRRVQTAHKKMSSRWSAG